MKKTILMIHGMGGGSWCWNKYKDYFTTKGFKCIIPDLRYHNVKLDQKALSKLGKISILDYVKDIENEINISKESPVIMGHSMGGLIAQKIASNHDIDSLILLAPASPFLLMV